MFHFSVGAFPFSFVFSLPFRVSLFLLTLHSLFVVWFRKLDPPGQPEIIGYTEGETVRMGQEVKLECISRGGNPLAQIVWFKNDVKIDHAYETSGRESRNVHIFRAEASDNNARFRCEASNPLSNSPMKAEVTLTVHCKYFNQGMLIIIKWGINK